MISRTSPRPSTCVDHRFYRTLVKYRKREMEGTQRVVQSGKVYRQIFDAEVQLNQALEATGHKNEKSGKGDTALRKELSSGIPVVHESRETTGAGMLNERQRTWTEGFPNEGYVENPVLYKYFVEEQRSVFAEPASSVASKEVRGLPDVIVPAKKGSDIIERIAESRRQRHDASLEDMHQSLGVISSELEPKIQAAGEELLGRFQENDLIIEEMMSRIQADEDLFPYTIEALEDLWSGISGQSVTRRQWIQELDTTLAQIEQDRMEKVREVFQEYSKTLEKIAHLMPPDLHRLLSTESQGINQVVLSNRRDYADLYARLMMEDIQREKQLHIRWSKRVEDWKYLHTESAMEKFKLYMESDEVIDPSNVRDVLDQMNREQETINAQRLDLVNSLREMRPPSSTKTSIYHWNERLTSISVSIDELNQQFFNNVYAEYEKVCQKCLAKVDEIKRDLTDRGVCTEARAQQVVNERCLPLVGERQTTFEKGLEEMDKDLEQHNLDTLQRLKSMFKFCQGAAHVWDVHELGLARQERALQEKLDQCRHLHDNQNQDREANLDIMMDRMRQEASEAALQGSLRKVLEMMEKIKSAYYKFHEDQSTIVGEYPSMVEEELQRFDKAVCKFFGVNRRHPDEPEEEPEPTDNKPQTPVTSKSSTKSPGRKQSKSRASSRASQQGETVQDESPGLPVAVSEVLSTAKGTMFYVLTVAGEHGIPPEADSKEPPQATATDTDKEKPANGNPTGAAGSDPPHDDADEQEEGDASNHAEDASGASTPASSGAFLTELLTAEGDNTRRPEDLPPYLASVEVPSTLLLDIKKAIRMNFLDYLESWIEESNDRAKAVVAAKVEELNSELDLRLHLHGPRSRRAELDVHNVRAAELVMHSERVTRHCKGINQALSDLKHRFGEMTKQHNQLAVKFREDIEALEVVFINATKSSRLVSLSNQLQVQQEKYMEKIRASLRQFRQHLDDTLQMLRESNARFIKSFKVFSDGGNFCPEEIDDFRKRLEKMSVKIDSSEGFIMADLEGMESKRLEQASKISREFEDRFKHHMIDLLFMEKIARWLTNAQVKIKAEATDSNMQAQKLGQCIDELEKKIDACERPNLDKQQVSPTQLNDFFCSILDGFHQRSVYLDCLKEAANQRPPSASPQATSLLAGARVGFTTETSSMPPVSRAGKQPQEDPSVNVIKNILKSQKNRLEFGRDLPDGELPPPVYNMQNSQSNVGLPQSASGGNPHSRDHTERTTKSRLSRHSDTDSRSKRSSKPGTATNASTSDRPQRATSGKPGKIDKKFYVFGELHEEGEETNFIGRVRRILRESLDGLLQASELYYRQKGTRAVTRPQALQETFEECANIIVAKLQSYERQGDEYQNQCLQEFRGQLSTLEDLAAHVPSCVIKELLHQAVERARNEHSGLDQDFQDKTHTWDEQKDYNKLELRPTLGHPQLLDKLQELCDKEIMRTQSYRQGVDLHSKEQQELAVKQAQTFTEQLASVSEQLFVQFDQLLTIDDTNPGRVPPTKFPTSELIRRRNAGLPLEDEENTPKVTRGKSSWEGIPMNEFSLPNAVAPPPMNRSQSSLSMASVSTATGGGPGGTTRRKSRMQRKPEAPNTTASVNTAKTTLGHTASKEARDNAYQEYKNHFKSVLASIDDKKSRLLVAEERWTDNWQESVKKVKELY